MEGRDVNATKQRRDGGAPRSPNIDGGWGAQCTLENKSAATLTCDGSDTGDQGMGDPAFPEDEGQSWVIDVIKASFDVQKKGGHLQAQSLQGFHVVYKGEAGIVCT